MESDSRPGWGEYYQKSQLIPSETLSIALGQFEKEGISEGLAVDLGCGAGRDTVELLRCGWSVLAIDREESAIEALYAVVQADVLPLLQTLVADFQSAEWEDVHLVNASLSLPFCPPALFPSVWKKIALSVLPGGRFSGHFFGDRDDWVVETGRFSCVSRAQIPSLFQGWVVEHFLEDEREMPLVTSDQTKHAHVFHIVAQKQ
ncbi:MAG: class I SAM-dependent methyltransferase [Cyanobacteria bacterium]|nr:class I SAM-dependent methyltransferase [Cyanobacteriota bacterium]